MSNILAITYESAIATTPSDTVNDPAGPFAGLYIGVAGTYVVTTSRGTKATFVGLSAGSILPVAITRVWVTGSQGSGASTLGMVSMPFKGNGT